MIKILQPLEKIKLFSHKRFKLLVVILQKITETELELTRDDLGLLEESHKMIVEILSGGIKDRDLIWFQKEIEDVGYHLSKNAVVEDLGNNQEYQSLEERKEKYLFVKTYIKDHFFLTKLFENDEKRRINIQYILIYCIATKQKSCN